MKTATTILKRDNTLADFDETKIVNAIAKAGLETGEFGFGVAKTIMEEVVECLDASFGEESIPTVENVQDIVETEIFRAGHIMIGKAYVLYRSKRHDVRNLDRGLDMIDEYLEGTDWRLKENSNMSYSLQGLNNHISGAVSAKYWLEKIYQKGIGNAHKSGDLHAHDLSMLSRYTYFGKEVVIAKHRGQVSVLSFEQLYELVEEPEQVLNAADDAWGKYPDPGLQVLDRLGWTNVTRLVRKRKNGKLRFVKNRGGRSVIVTDNHPMMTIRGQVESKDIVIREDRLFTADVPRLLGMEPLFNNDTIDLVAELVNRGLGGRATDKPYFNGLALGDTIPEGDGTVHTLTFTAPRFIRLTQGFGFFLGMLLAEGYLTYDNDSYCTSLTSRKLNEMQRANQGLMENGWAGIITLKSNGMYKLRVRNRLLRFLLEAVFKIRPGSRHKTLPIGMLTYHKPFLTGVVAGLLDGDGTRNGSTSIQLRMACRTLLEQLAIALPFLGLFPRDRNCEGVGSERQYNGRTIHQNYPLYGLGFRKMEGVPLPAVMYEALQDSKRAWQDETVDSWHIVLNSKETEVPDDYIYDVTTETHTLLVNGMLNHNCTGQ